MTRLERTLDRASADRLRNIAAQRADRLARDAALPPPAPQSKRTRIARNGKSQADHMIEYVRTIGPMTADDGAALYEGDTADGLPRDMSQACSKLVTDGVFVVCGTGVSRYGYPASIYKLA
jgi:hypothetical protein